jgi:sporulation protein YlmC with PRC-barrel domain
MKLRLQTQTAAIALAIGMCAAPPASAQNAKQDQQNAQTQQQSGQQNAAQKQQQQTDKAGQNGQTLQQQYQQTAQQENKQNQQAVSNNQGQQPPLILLQDWDYDKIYGSSWSLDKLMDIEVIGPTGDEIGEVENVIINNEGRIVGIIAEVGGFIDIGDTHVFVPWDQITFNQTLERVTIPVTQDNVEDYVYKDPVLMQVEAGHRQVVQSDPATGWQLWKASDLLEDYAYLNENVGYGWVSDLIFTAEGDLHAVVVNADAVYGGGYYAYPYYGYGYGWYPGAPYYYLGYDRDDVVNMSEAFDYDQMKDQVAMKNKDGAATTGSGSANNQDNKKSK